MKSKGGKQTAASRRVLSTATIPFSLLWNFLRWTTDKVFLKIKQYYSRCNPSNSFNTLEDKKNPVPHAKFDEFSTFKTQARHCFAFRN